jgi:hypothetical protein
MVVVHRQLHCLKDNLKVQEIEYMRAFFHAICTYKVRL